ncbi:protein TRANSPARENT TESTA 9-like isoform X1 [Pyrus x bretschneideri]|uniref:protein TRANSPARENT TESTA 9-like isoform X1 n=1 Tax=Pyrus x bretschneideri TaxID=225117 RepID=UPI00202DB672|nr:protein TRANSPARENT TESTA 9-like isoform X1 [Pyrus x bretschneideri]
MWFSFWKSRDRFSLDELRYLTDQLIKVQIVNDVNKDFVIEALRSIAELITYGDQHDSTFFEFFMEKQVMGEFVRILKVSRTMTVSLQLLQTISIMIQNLKNEHAIYYMFSNEHMNYLITFAFDFQNEELLSYYISFLRAISGKLDRNTISLLVKTQNDEVVSFPLYVEAIRFAFHEESMVRTAIRALTLNVYHVGDESVNRYVTSAPHADYFSNLVTFFQKQCINLNALVSDSMKNPGAESADTTALISAAVDEIEDNLYYFSDVISAGIPDVGRLITDNILKLLIFPLLLPSLTIRAVEGIQIGAATSLYLVCCILHIVKIKDLANTICAALFFPLDSFFPKSGAKPNGCTPFHGFAHESQPPGSNTKEGVGILRDDMPNLSSSPQREYDYCDFHLSLREALISYIASGDDIQVAGSLSVLATLLQTKELDESMLDALGILPQRKQHKKLLLQALVGEVSGEEQLFSSEDSSSKDGIECGSELDSSLQKLKEQFGLLCSSLEVRASPRVHRFQVLDALVSLFCRSNISAETLWYGGWLLRQLLPYSRAEFNSHHLKMLNDSYKNCASALLMETRGVWPDLLVTVLCDEWKRCKRAIEASSPQKEPKCILLSSQRFSSEDGITSDSSFAAGERMCELVKVFVILHQLQIFSLGRTLPEKPPIKPPADAFENSRAQSAGLDAAGPKLGTELRLVDAVPCRIAFERGKERHFSFLAISLGASGWVVLAEELPLKEPYGVVRMVAPLAGTNFILVSSTRFFLLKPKPDDKHSRWLHLRIRPSTLPFVEPARYGAYGKAKTKALVDGRWTLAFRDEESCNSALSMVLEEINLQSNEVERRLKPLLDLENFVESSNSSRGPPRTSSSHSTLSNSF